LCTESALVVVVPPLHYLVPDPVSLCRWAGLPVGTRQGRASRVERCLERLVEACRAGCALVHRGEDLDALHRVEKKAPGDTFADQLDHRLHSPDGVLLLDEAELSLPEGPLLLRKEALGDAVHEQRIHHGGLIDNAEVAGERIRSVFPEAPLARRELEYPVDGLRLAAGDIAHPARRTAHGRGQLDPKPPPLADREEALQHRGLPRARPSRDHREPAAQGGAHALDLTGSQSDAQCGLGLREI